jgi:hypothetical protein
MELEGVIEMDLESFAYDIPQGNFRNGHGGGFSNLNGDGFGGSEDEEIDAKDHGIGNGYGCGWLCFYGNLDGDGSGQHFTSHSEP